MGSQADADEMASRRTGTTPDPFAEGIGAVDSSRAALNVGTQGEESILQHTVTAAGQKDRQRGQKELNRRQSGYIRQDLSNFTVCFGFII